MPDLERMYAGVLDAFLKEDTERYERLKAAYQCEIDKLEPTFIGPLWQKDEHGKFILPEKTLGWQAIAWCYEYLNSPNGQGPLRFTGEQARFILWWYAVNDQGKFVYRKGILQRLKGWGKDPVAAIIALIEFVGPCRFGGWDDNGDPIGVDNPVAWIQIAAVNQQQTGNTSKMFPLLISDQMIATYGIKLTPAAEVIRAYNGKRTIEMVTSSPRAIEGGRPTFTILNEPHHWIQTNDGHEMYAAVERNMTKVPNSRSLAISNAFRPGEDSVMEKLRKNWEDVQNGLARDTRIFYDSIEAHPETPLNPEALEIALPKIAGDAHWLDLEEINEAIQDTTIPVSMHRRFYLNQVVAGEDALHSPKTWDPLARPGETLRPGDEVLLGFDGGRTDDATALVAIRVRDMFIQPLGCWQKPDHYQEAKWEVNRDEVDSAVHNAFRTYKVRGMYCDVALWESYIAQWQDAYGEKVAVRATPHKPFEFDMRNQKKAVMAHERFLSSIFDGKIRHAGQSNPLARLLRSHVLNVHRRDTPQGVGFGKQSRESSRKVDLYAAAMLAHEALIDFRQRGEVKKERSGRVWGF